MYHRFDDTEDDSDIRRADEAAYEADEHDGSTWDACHDLDQFLADVYRYYRCKGLNGILAAEALNCVALLFTVSFSFTLVFLVNWEDLSNCTNGETPNPVPPPAPNVTDPPPPAPNTTTTTTTTHAPQKHEINCKDVHFFYEHPFNGMRLYHYIALLYFFSFLVFCLISVWRAVTEIRKAADMQSFFELSLRVYDLNETPWAEVLDRLSKRQNVAPFCIKQDSLSPLEITNILMRQDNFLIALINHGALFTDLHGWIPKRFLLSKSVIYCLRGIIFPTMFDQNHARVVQNVVDHPEILERKFRFCGALVLFLIGPVIVFVAIYFFMRHAEDVRSGRSFPMQRDWTPFAKWTFREYNELPHNFLNRLHAARQEARLLLAHTASHSPILDALRRCVKYIAGSLLAVIVVLIIMDDTFTLSVKIFHRTLWWYLAFLGFLVAFLADSETEPAPVAERDYLETVWRTVQHTHYFPRDYDRNEMSRKIFRIICRDYKDNFLCPRIQMLIEEMIGVIVCPFFLLFHFPKTARAICDVIRSTHYSSKALGDWCRHGNLKVTENDVENLRVRNFGKCPKSLVNFLMVHSAASEDLDIPPESLQFLHEIEKRAKEERPLVSGLVKLEPLTHQDPESGSVALRHESLKGLDQRPRDGVWTHSAPHFYWLDNVISAQYEETFFQETNESAVGSRTAWNVLDGRRGSSGRTFEYFDVEVPQTRSNRGFCVIM